MAKLTLYRNHPEFGKELEEITKPYREIFHQQVVLIQTTGNPFSDEFSTLSDQLKPYREALEVLARKWKINAPWAVRALMLSEILVILSSHQQSVGRINFEFLNTISPMLIEMEPLKIEVSASILFYYSREDVLAEISKRLIEFKAKIKKKGITEFPSSLEKHAGWWFEHYVSGKKYDEIAQQEAYTPGGSLISYAKNVGKAVREFGKLIDINPKMKIN
jgi:hypothetical protein